MWTSRFISIIEEYGSRRCKRGREPTEGVEENAGLGPRAVDVAVHGIQRMGVSKPASNGTMPVSGVVRFGYNTLCGICERPVYAAMPGSDGECAIEAADAGKKGVFVDHCASGGHWFHISCAEKHAREWIDTNLSLSVQCPVANPGCKKQEWTPYEVRLLANSLEKQSLDKSGVERFVYGNDDSLAILVSATDAMGTVTNYRGGRGEECVVERVFYDSEQGSKAMKSKEVYEGEKDSERLVEILFYIGARAEEAMYLKEVYIGESGSERVIEKVQYEGAPGMEKKVSSTLYDHTGRMANSFRYSGAPRSERLVENSIYEGESGSERLVERLFYTGARANEQMVSRAVYEGERDSERMVEKVWYNDALAMVDRVMYEGGKNAERKHEMFSYEGERENERMISSVVYEGEKNFEIMVEEVWYEGEKYSERKILRRVFNNCKLVKTETFEGEKGSERVIRTDFENGGREAVQPNERPWCAFMASAE
jgi:hypothetical protein